MKTLKDWWKCWQVKVVVITILSSLLAPILCNERPLFCYDSSGKWCFPAFELNEQEKFIEHSDCKYSMYALIPYSPGRSDLANADFKSPFSVQTSNRTYLGQLRQRHWLGTDLRGSDVLADMIFAMRNSLLISVIATFISFVIGSFMGVAAGWNTDAGGFQVKESEFILILIFAFLIFFSVSELASIKEKCLFLAFTFSGVYFAFKIVKRLQLKWRVKAFYIKIPAGFLIDRLSELFLAIPRLLMLIVVIQFLPRSIPTLAFAIGITSWVDVSRLIKAEVIILKQQSFVEAAGMTGMKKLRLFLKHLLPNIWPSVMVVLMYCFSGNILMDASLSFLGFGLPADTMSIGGMLATARTYYEAWWMFLFPGIWISLLIYAVFTLPDALLKSNAARY